MATVVGRVLIVDDNRELAENLCEILEDEGHSVQVWSDPRVAMKNAQGGWDVAVLDLRMPEVDGATVAEVIRQAGPDTGLVFVTAFADGKLLARARALQPCTVLTKPVGPLNLIDAVAAALPTAA